MLTEVPDNKEKEIKNEKKKEREGIPVKYAVTEGTRNSPL